MTEHPITLAPIPPPPMSIIIYSQDGEMLMEINFKYNFIEVNPSMKVDAIAQQVLNRMRELIGKEPQ